MLSPTVCDSENLSPPDIGFQGLNCEINYDECVYGFCANNSTCVDLVADYGCICPVGFVGKR